VRAVRPRESGRGGAPPQAVHAGRHTSADATRRGQHGDGRGGEGQQSTAHDRRGRGWRRAPHDFVQGRGAGGQRAAELRGQRRPQPHRRRRSAGGAEEGAARAEDQGHAGLDRGPTYGRGLHEAACFRSAPGRGLHEVRQRGESGADEWLARGALVVVRRHSRPHAAQQASVGAYQSGGAAVRRRSHVRGLAQDGDGEGAEVLRQPQCRHRPVPALQG